MAGAARPVYGCAMDAVIRPRTIGLLAVAAALGGCSSPPPPPDPPPQPSATAAPAPEAPQEIPREPVASGKDCVKAEAQCGGGVCALRLENKCEQPVTCALAILTVCEDKHDLIQVKGKARETFASGSTTEISAPAKCTSGAPVSTKVQGLECQ